jgi:superfamily II DNA or RNA helicase
MAVAARKPLPVAVRRWVEYFAGKRCEQCGGAIDGLELLGHWDHVHARALGGEDVAFNLQQLCHRCNRTKWDALTPQVRQRLREEERRMLEIGDSFQSAPAQILGNERLREPQRAAYLSIYDFLVKKRRPLPAVVRLPTGCGKSGIIACLPYGIANGRVLIVAPNLTIRDGITEVLTGGSTRPPFLLDRGVLAEYAQLPRVVVLAEHANREDCLRADVIVANVQQIQSWLDLFPTSFFDLVIVDEGHHTPASSWRKISEKFRAAKKVYLTATPFRADGRSIYGEIVYSFSLAEAMSRGYVKEVVRVDAVPSRLVFVADGQETEYTTGEILEMREELWFSRGVALSQTCNRSIVDKSLQILRKKRASGFAHQVIAVACSIPHARQIMALYRARGVSAALVHSRMEMAEREATLQRFERGGADVIVQVGLLGEGYDHPPLSIAAIFRPFRSLAPYAQFVGRVLRRIAGREADDNVAHVVGHVGLNQDELWGYFKNETAEARILQEIEALEVEELLTREEREALEELPASQQPEVTFEEIVRFDVDTFLPTASEERQRFQEELGVVEQIVGGWQERGLSVPHVREVLQHLRTPVESEPVMLPITRPDLERHEYRRLLASTVQKAAGRVANELELGPGRELVSLLGRGDEKNNYQVVIRLINHGLNRRMQKPESGSERGGWTLSEVQAALKQVDAAARETQREIQRALRVA